MILGFQIPQEGDGQLYANTSDGVNFDEIKYDVNDSLEELGGCQLVKKKHKVKLQLTSISQL